MIIVHLNKYLTYLFDDIRVPTYLLCVTLLEYQFDDAIFRIINQYKDKPPEFNINCLDPLNRSALIIGIEKENIDLINLLLEAGIQVKVITNAVIHNHWNFSISR